MRVHKKLFSGITINFTFFVISPKLQRIWSWNFGFATRKIWVFIWYQKMYYFWLSPGDENVIGIRSFKGSSACYYHIQPKHSETPHQSNQINDKRHVYVGCTCYWSKIPCYYPSSNLTWIPYQLCNSLMYDFKLVVTSTRDDPDRRACVCTLCRDKFTRASICRGGQSGKVIRSVGMTLHACRLVIPLALAQLYKNHHQSGNAASGKLVWKQH